MWASWAERMSFNRWIVVALTLFLVSWNRISSSTE